MGRLLDNVWVSRSGNAVFLVGVVLFVIRLVSHWSPLGVVLVARPHRSAFMRVRRPTTRRGRPLTTSVGHDSEAQAEQSSSSEVMNEWIRSEARRVRPDDRECASLIRRGDDLLREAHLLKRPIDKRLGRYQPMAAAGVHMSKGMRYALDGPPKTNSWLKDVDEYVEEQHPEYADRIVHKGLGGANVDVEIAAIQQNLAVLHE